MRKFGLVLVAAVALLAAATAQARAAIALAEGSGSFTETDTRFQRTVTTSVTPTAPEAGDPVDILITDRQEFFAAEPDPGCTGRTIQDSDESPTLWYVARVTPPESTFAGGYNEIALPVRSGTINTTQTFRCDPQRLVVQYTHDLQLDPSSLEPGCYQLLGSNFTLVDPGAATGTVAMFSVGGVNCQGELAVDVTVGYRYVGSVKSVAGRAVGFDFVRVDGESEALARVGDVCLETGWQATADLKVATSTPMFWNDEVGPFTSPNWTLVSRTPPTHPNGYKKKFTGPGWKGLVFEHVRITPESGCGGTALQRLDLNLQVTSPGKILSLRHLVVAHVYDTGGRLLASVEAEPGTFSKKDLTEEDIVTERVVVNPR